MAATPSNSASDRRPKAVIVVESTFGAGHMRRASLISQALAKKDIDVTVITSQLSYQKGDSFDYGDRVRFWFIPSLVAHPETGKATLTPSGRDYENDPIFRNQRRRALIDAIDSTRPDIVICESWPFARGRFDGEMLSVIEHLRKGPPNPLVYCLIRDVLFYVDGRKGDNPEQDTVDIVNSFVDGVLVAGDSRYSSLKSSFQLADEITCPVLHPGYFVSPMPPREEMSENKRPVVISTGGGFSEDRVLPLIRSAINARGCTTFRDRVWHLLVGKECPDHILTALQKEARIASADNIVIGKFSRHFHQMLTNAAASISAGGSNTTLEAVKTKMLYGIPVVIAPRYNTELSQSEQPFRSKCFESMGFVKIAEPEDVKNPSRLAQLVNQAAAGAENVTVPAINLNGAEYAAAFVAAECRARRR